VVCERAVVIATEGQVAHADRTDESR
jgi:hypothetical protein